MTLNVQNYKPKGVPRKDNSITNTKQHTGHGVSELHQLCITVMVSVLECGRSWVRAKDHTICIYYFSSEYVALRSKNKDWLAQDQDNVSKWSDRNTRGLLFH
jgi:hypothetical protein